MEWVNPEYPQWKTLKATFSSEAAAEEFYLSYKEGYNFAEQYDFVDEIPTQETEETD